MNYQCCFFKRYLKTEIIAFRTRFFSCKPAVKLCLKKSGYRELVKSRDSYKLSFNCLKLNCEKH